MLSKHQRAMWVTLFLSITPFSIFASNSTWEGTSSSDLNSSGNWSPIGIPTSTALAIFDSTIPSINLNPTASGSDFSVLGFDFPSSASDFNFTFSNTSLLLGGTGISGAQTDTTIAVNNINNTSAFTEDQASFTDDVSASSGSAVINLTNNGISSAGSMNMLNGNQFSTLIPFSILDGGYYTVVNFGTNNSSSSGLQIATIAQSQFLIGLGCTFGDDVTISVTNRGINSSSSSGTGNQIGYVGFSLGNNQLSIGGVFQAGDFFNFSAANIGEDNSSGSGSNSVGSIANYYQVFFGGEVIVNDSATITISNSGTNSCSGSNSNTGFVAIGQLLLQSFQAGNLLNFSVTNVGEDTSTDSGSNKVGFLNNNQVIVSDGFTAVDGATILLSNRGTNSSSGSNSHTGCVEGFGGQIFMPSAFQAGKNLNLTLTNDGTDSSTGSGNNRVGFVQSPQLEVDDAFVVGDSATITISNSGINSSSGTGSSTGYIEGSGQQFLLFSTFQAGNLLNLSISNEGQDNSSAAVTNSIGYVVASQIEATDTFTVGNSATMSISNNGINTNNSSSSFVGYISSNQFQFDAAFTAGTSLSMTATNSATSSGGSAAVGQCLTQILFQGACTVDDRSTITAVNSGSGTISSQQILFSQGFALTSGSATIIAENNDTGIVLGSQIELDDFTLISGSATIQATNEGSVTDHGIHVQGGSSGGDVNIVLEGASLYVETGASSFTIGALSGDSASTAQSNVSLIISTDASISTTFAGVISDFPSVASSLVSAGSGTQILSGTNTYTGGTTLTGGVLSISSDSNLGAVTSVITGNGGTLLTSIGITLNASRGVVLNTSTATSFDTGGSVTTIAGTITGSGTLAKINAGTLTLSGTNSGSWNTTVEEGTLSISAANNVGSGTVTLAGGTLSVTAPITMANAFAITSSSTLSASEELVLSGLLTGSDGQTLTLEGVGPISLGQIAVNSGVFVVAGVMGGTQDLVKTGDGTLTLTGHSTYTGKTRVNAGALEVSGNIVTSPDPIVALGALLLGTGTVGDTDVYGSIKGGGDVLGTLMVEGSLTLRDGSKFITAITPDSVSLIDVEGNIVIETGANYFLVFTQGTYVAGSRVVLRGDSIAGTFSSETDTQGPLRDLFLSLDYTPTEVILNFKSTQSLAYGQNAINVARALDTVIAFNRQEIITKDASMLELPKVLLSLYTLTTPKKMTYALNQLHPAQLKGMAISQENNAIDVRESLSQRMTNELEIQNCLENSQCCEKNKKTITAWISGLGDTLKQDNKVNYLGPLTGYRASTGGVVTGIDGQFFEYCYAGVLGGYTHSHLHFEEGKGTGDISSGYAGIYFSALGKMFYANASVIGSWSSYRADRHIEYAEVNLTAKNSHGGNQLLSHLDTGINLNCLGLTIRPFDRFDYVTQTERGYAEHNASEWNLTVKKMNAILINNELGLQFEKCYCLFKSKWILSPKFSWIRQVRVKGEDFHVRFTQGGPSFLIRGYFPDRSLVSSGLALTGVMLEDALKFNVYYSGEFTGGYSANNVGGLVSYSF